VTPPAADDGHSFLFFVLPHQAEDVLGHARHDLLELVELA
jgi:hypothetical protein